MICYRRHGHNEADKPSFTQPLMYDLIDAKRSIRKLYTEALIGRGDITMEEAERRSATTRPAGERLRRDPRGGQGAHREFARPSPGRRTSLVARGHPTGISEETVKRIVETQLNMPEGFTVHPRLRRCCNAAARWSPRTTSTGGWARPWPSVRC